jgi:hypothetical protein
LAYTLSFDYFVPYRELNGTDRPIVVAELRVNGSTEYFPMLLDCGADNIVLPAYLLATFDLAAAGLEEEKARTVWGIQTGYTVPDVQLKLPDYDQDWSVSIPMRFSPYLDSSGFGLLGREKLFARIRFAFDERSGSGFYLSLL